MSNYGGNNIRTPRDFALFSFSPVVLLMASQDAQDVCKRSNLNLAELLKPFSRINSKINVKDAGNVGYTIDQFNLKFLELKDFEEPSLDSQIKVLSEVVEKSKTKMSPPQIYSSEDVPAFIKTPQYEITPWYYNFRDNFLKTVRPSEHEYFDHPVACVIAISSANTDPISSLLKLYQSQNPPEIFSKGFMDPNILKYYLLIHDNSQGNLHKAEELFKQMRSTFGMHSHMLCINSSPQLSQDSVVKTVWETPTEKKEKNPSSTRTSLMDSSSSEFHPLIDVEVPKEMTPFKGQFMTSKDLEAVNTFVREFTTQSLIPFMELNIYNWNETIAAPRRGVTGRLFSAGKKYFGGMSKPTPIASQYSNVVFHYSSPEAQLRKLADYSFMLQDYKFAFSIYDTVKKDFNNEKSWKHFAGVMEMMGFCCSIISDNIKEIESYFEQAQTTYLLRCQQLFYAIRSTLFCADLMRSRSLYREATNSLIRMASESGDLSGALFLEQVACNYIRARPSLVRKYALFMILSAMRYQKGGQTGHAFRAYKTAYGVLEGKNWGQAEDHIQFNLAKNAFSLGLIDQSVDYLVNLLKNSQEYFHSFYLKEFVTIYKQYLLKKPGHEMIELGIPRINDEHIQVVLRNQRGSPDLFPPEDWKVLEQSAFDYSFPPVRSKNLKERERPVCVIGEPISLSIEVSNTLNVSLQVSNIKLCCYYNSHEVVIVQDPLTDEKSYIIKEIEQDVYSLKDLSKSSDNSFKCEKIENFTLYPSEKKIFDITFTPLKEGTLIVKGITYTLNDSVQCCKVFKKKGHRLNNTSEEMRNIIHSEDQSFNLIVAPPMPLLEVEMENVPNLMISGEVKKIKVNLKNEGQKPLSKIFVKVSHPPFFYFGKPEHVNQDVYPLEEDEKSSRITQLSYINRLKDPSIFEIDLKSPILPGSSIQIPLWIRGDRIGNFPFQFVFGYEAETRNLTIPMRSHRHFFMLMVNPSIKISASSRPSASKSNQFLISMDVENLHTDSTIKIKQISAMSISWKIEPLSIQNDEDYMLEVGPREVCTFCLRATRSEDFVFNSNELPEFATSSSIHDFLFGEKVKCKIPATQFYFSDLKNEKNKKFINSKVDSLTGLLTQSHVMWKQNKLMSTYSHLSPSIVNMIFPVLSTNEMDISIYWSCVNEKNNQVSHGHHYFLGVNMGIQEPPLLQSEFSKKLDSLGSRSLFASTQQEKALLVESFRKVFSNKPESPLKFHLIIPDTFQFDFEGNNQSCEVEITLVVINRSLSKPIEFICELLPSDTSSQVDQLEQMKLLPFQWVGTIKYSGTLEPDTENRYSLFATFSQPGIYDLSRIKMKIANTDSQQILATPHYLRIEQSP